jgi:RND family efflux transporter MFP subunit
LGLGCSSGKNEKGNETEQAAVAVRVTTLSPDTFVEYGEYYGKTKGLRQATLKCYTGGRVTHITAGPGDRVTKGQHLARIDAEKAQTRYETAVLNEKIAKDNYERTKKHVEAGNASQLQLDRQKLAWMNAKASRIEAQRMREGALAIAPFSGMITDRYIELYQDVAPNSPTFAIAQLSNMEVVVLVPEGDLFDVDPDDPATVHLPAIDSSRRWDARIETIARSAQPNTHKYRVTIRLDNPQYEIKPGLTARVRIALQHLDSQVVVPTDAIITSGIQHYVYVAQNDTAHKRIVETAESNETHTRITDGLRHGEEIIIAGQQRVKHNVPLSIER